MISSFKDTAAENLYHGRNTKEIRIFPIDSIKISLRKLDLLNAAADLRDLRSTPGHHLKILKGALKGFYSIGLNDQWRIIFRWAEKNACDVMITADHVS